MLDAGCLSSVSKLGISYGRVSEVGEYRGRVPAMLYSPRGETQGRPPHVVPIWKIRLVY